MSISVNSIVIGGSLTADPLHNAAVGVVKFAVAINERYKAKDGTMKESVCFVDCEAWSKTAEMVAQYLHKGDPVLVEGKLKSDSWQTQDGQKRQKILVRAERVHFLSRKPSDAISAEPEPPKIPHVPKAAADGPLDEPPF